MPQSNIVKGIKVRRPTKISFLKSISLPTLAPIELTAPAGMCKIKNLYVNPVTEKLVVEYDDIPVP
jgi:hypothetical protein